MLCAVTGELPGFCWPCDLTGATGAREPGGKSRRAGRVVQGEPLTPSSVSWDHAGSLADMPAPQDLWAQTHKHSHLGD